MYNCVREYAKWVKGRDSTLFKYAKDMIDLSCVV